jgi:NADH-quinone oxidoreductase subunit D
MSVNLNWKKTTTNYNNMETLINHFKYWSTGIKIAVGNVAVSVESPKGEFTVTLFANNSEKPYRCKIRSPAYHHLQIIPKLTRGHWLADLVTLIGTVDIVFGEIDR